MSFANSQLSIYMVLLLRESLLIILRVMERIL
jgi:hypothetical protein